MGQDPLVALRLFADIRQSALTLRCLDTPHAPTRARLIRDPAVFKALTVMLEAARQLVGPSSEELFWHTPREAQSDAEKRFDALRRSLEKDGTPLPIVDEEELFS